MSESRRVARAALREAGHRVLPLAEFALAREEAAAQHREWVALAELGIDVSNHGECPGAVAYLDWANRAIGFCSTPWEHRDALSAYVSREALRAQDARTVSS